MSYDLYSVETDIKPQINKIKSDAVECIMCSSRCYDTVFYKLTLRLVSYSVAWIVIMCSSSLTSFCLLTVKLMVSLVILVRGA